MKLKQMRVDGYKNLINCVVNLGDFNVLVGPNNSGKSNFLEAIQMLLPICFGDNELRSRIFEGQTPPQRFGSSICHLEKHRNKPMTLGAVFEVQANSKLWSVEYEVTIQCGEPKKPAGFLRESLTGKEVAEPLKPGRANVYFIREDKELRVREKGRKTLRKHPISKDNSGLLAISSLYADFEGLPAEFEIFVNAINWLAITKIFAISPKDMRDAIDSEKSIEGIEVSSFDLSLVADEMEKEGKYAELFKGSLRDIFELEDAYFSAKDVQVSSKKGKATEKAKRMRLFAMKRKGDVYSLVDEYSDGTLTVVGILEALFSEDRRGPILCLEELENCLHPAAIERLLRFLQDHAGKWPVLITTHSAYLLNGVNPEDVIVCVVDESGATHFERVKSTKQLRDHLNKSLMSFGELLVEDFAGFREG